MSQPIQVLQRTMRLLASFDHDHSEMGVTELARRLNLHKATVHRILATLESGGFVQQNPATEEYRLGFRLVELGLLAMEQISLRREALPLMRELLQEHGETVDLAVCDDGEMVYLEVLESPQPVKIAVKAGRRLPIHCTASGKAYLAYTREDETDALLARQMKACTPHTICDRESLEEDLRLTRERGYSTSQEEFELGINAVAAPVTDSGGQVVAVLAIAGPAYRLPPDRIAELGKAVQRTAQNLSYHLGARLA